MPECVSPNALYVGDPVVFDPGRERPGCPAVVVAVHPQLKVRLLPGHEDAGWYPGITSVGWGYVRRIS